MYNQLIYFIVVLLLFSVQRQTGKPPAAYWPDAFYIAALFCVFIFYCRRTFERLRKASGKGMPLSALTHAHYRAQTLLSIAAIGFLAVYIYAFNLTAYLRVIPGYDKFMTVSGIAGLIIFLIHLAVIWYWSHTTYQIMFGAKISRTDYIKGQLSFTSVILVPWFLISIATDLLQFIKAPSFMASDLGQVILISLTLTGFVLLGPWLIIRMWGCKPLPDDHVKAELQQFCSDHDFKTGGLLLWSVFGSEMLTAGVVGILPGLRYILITPGLLRTLNTDELKAVVAHEMGHVRKKHMLLFVLLLVLFILFAYDLSDVLTWAALSNRTIFNWSAAPGELSQSVASLLSALPVIVLMVLYFRFIFGFFLRNCERQADLYGMELVGDPRPLISSLEKIAFRSGRIEDLPSWHHFSITQRIQFLVEAFKNRDLIRRHNIKLYGSVLVFIAAISGFLFVNWKANEAGLMKNLHSEVELRVLERAITEDPGNAAFLAEYGGVLYEKGRYSEAESVLRAALMNDPQNASVLNNLAWLYATGPSPFRNPREALDLAIQAADLSPTADILDTLAEAYYINGRYADALATINEAISVGGPQQNHYAEQKKKFQNAVNGKLRSS
ncbi:Tetratricopeptide TPR_2 repeat protein [Syntrophobacter sp. SbD1]|nr:Tetratricopeptide TPR_2 repeat protein [Syntrophobacter sp. SbD1]